MNWFQRNFKAIIYIAFLVPILTVAFVSISHVTTWYGITNPVSWAIYLSVGIEIAALAALAAISAQMGNKVYFPFGIVTLIQFIGNIFFAYQYIDVTSAQFQSWVEMVDPIVSYIGVESGNMISHKRFLALFAGVQTGFLPLEVSPLPQGSYPPPFLGLLKSTQRSFLNQSRKSASLSIGSLSSSSM